jgi:hypothetical protein
MNDFYRVVEQYVREAVNTTDNIDDNGFINWNFVDADVFMRVNPTKQCVGVYYECFEKACDKVESELV